MRKLLELSTLYDNNQLMNTDSIVILVFIIIIDSCDVDARPTPLKESCHRGLWQLQITITLTESA